MNKEQCKNCPLIEEIKLLRAEIKMLREKLEKYERPKKDSGNSSLPPSSDRNKKYPPREKSGKKMGGQKGHKGSAKLMADNPDKIIELYPEKCSCCGENHFIKKDQVLERRQLFEIPEIKPFVIEYQKKAGICNKCGNRNTGEFPINAPVTFGNSITSIIGYLNVQHHVSYERISDIFQDLLGFNRENSSQLAAG